MLYNASNIMKNKLAIERVQKLNFGLMPNILKCQKTIVLESPNFHNIFVFRLLQQKGIISIQKNQKLICGWIFICMICVFLTEKLCKMCAIFTHIFEQLENLKNPHYSSYLRKYKKSSSKSVWNTSVVWKMEL